MECPADVSQRTLEKVGNLEVTDGYNLGYLLMWSGYAPVVDILLDVYERETDLHPQFTGVHNLMVADITHESFEETYPQSEEEARILRDELAVRISLLPLNYPVSFEVHALLGAVIKAHNLALRYSGHSTEV